jgi:hypothetical protein
MFSIEKSLYLEAVGITFSAGLELAAHAAPRPWPGTHSLPNVTFLRAAS